MIDRENGRRRKRSKRKTTETTKMKEGQEGKRGIARRAGPHRYHNMEGQKMLEMNRNETVRLENKKRPE